MSGFVDRMIRAAKLDAHVYEEVEADPSAISQAMGVVVLASIAGGIAQIRYAGVMGLVTGAIVALIGWAIWAGVIYLVGTKMLPEPATRADWGQLLRTIGFAYSPGVLRVLAIIPVIGLLVSLVVWVWVLVATVIAVRQALDYTSTGRAIGVCLIGWLIMIVINVGLLLIIAPFRP